MEGKQKAKESKCKEEEPNMNDLTEEDDEDDDDSADLLEIPVNVEIITDEESDSTSSPPGGKKRKTSDTNSQDSGKSSGGNLATLKEHLKGKSSRECFEEFFTEELFEMIVKETEKYVRVVKRRKDFSMTVTDVKIFLGFMIFTGYHRLPCERDYWSDDEDLGIPLVKAAMTRNAFAEMKSHLHFHDSSKPRDSHVDKAYKIRPLMEVLNKNFQKWNVLHENLSTGEILVSCYGPGKGRKSVKVVYKLGLLCGDGYCYKFWLCGDKQEKDLHIDDKGSLENVQSQGNPLADFHLSKPHQMTNKKCSLGVKYYELLLRKHSIPIRGKKWYWCLITRMIDMAIVNAYHIFRECQDGQKCLKQFRREIAVPYLKLGHCRRISRNLAPNPSRTHVSEDVRFDGLNHIIGKREKQRRCQFQNCKGRPKTYCVKCNITLCTTCFPRFHFR